MSPDLVIAWSTAALTCATFSLVFYTALLWKEQKRQKQPEVIVSIEQDRVQTSVLNFVVQNIGGGGAYDVHIEALKDITVKYSKNEPVEYLKDRPFMRQKYLKPQGSFKVFLGCYWHLQNKDSEFKVTYRDKNNKNYKNIFQYNLVSFEGISATESVENTITNALKEIAENTKSVANKRLKVDMFDRDDRELEKQEYETRLKQRKIKQDI